MFWEKWESRAFHKILPSVPNQSVRQAYSIIGKRKMHVVKTCCVPLGEENFWEWETSACWGSLCGAAGSGLWEELQHVHLPSALAVCSAGPAPLWQVCFLLLCFTLNLPQTLDDIQQCLVYSFTGLLVWNQYVKYTEYFCLWQQKWVWITIYRKSNFFTEVEPVGSYIIYII